MCTAHKYLLLLYKVLYYKYSILHSTGLVVCIKIDVRIQWPINI